MHKMCHTRYDYWALVCALWYVCGDLKGYKLQKLNWPSLAHRVMGFVFNERRCSISWVIRIKFAQNLIPHFQSILLSSLLLLMLMFNTAFHFPL